MREFGIKRRKITPRYPRRNGEAERLNRINKVVKNAIAESRDWRKAIDDRLLACRTTPHTITGQLLAATMFGRNLNDKLPSLRLNAPIKIIRTSYRQHDAENKQKGKRYHDMKKKAQSSSTTIMGKNFWKMHSFCYFTSISELFFPPSPISMLKITYFMLETFMGLE